MKSLGIAIGVNYINTPSIRLWGCCNDARNVARHMKRANFDKIELYTDEDPKTRIYTTAEGIVSVIKRIVEESKNYDQIWFHYSGHGSQVPDEDGEEEDGLDECLIPSDYRIKGVVTDDTIREILYDISPNCRLLFTFDCCHSGSMMDMKYTLKGEKFVKIPEKTPLPGCVTCVSACRDEESAYETGGSGILTKQMMTLLSRYPGIESNTLHFTSLLAELIKNTGMKQRLVMSTNNPPTCERPIFMF